MYNLPSKLTELNERVRRYLLQLVMLLWKIRLLEKDEDKD